MLVFFILFNFPTSLFPQLVYMLIPSPSIYIAQSLLLQSHYFFIEYFCLSDLLISEN